MAMSAQDGKAQAPAISQAQAVAVVEHSVGIPAGYTLNSVQLQTQWPPYNGHVYTIMWQGPQPQQSGTLYNQVPKFVNAVVDANTGMLLSYQVGGSGNWFDAPSITVDQAKQAAQRWLNELAPAESAQMELVSDTGVSKLAAPFVFTFARVVNGIPAPFDGAQLAIGLDGSLVGYQFSWHDVTFPATKPSITADKATAAYRSALNLQLTYSADFSPMSIPKTYEELTKKTNRAPP